MRRLFIDTGAFFALSDRSDRHHETAVDIARHVAAEGIQTFTTDYVVAETYSLIMYKVGQAPARNWLSNLEVRVEFGDTDDLDSAKAVLGTYNSLELSLVDALSMAIMRRTRTGQVFTFDRHFAAAGFQVLGREGWLK